MNTKSVLVGLIVHRDQVSMHPAATAIYQAAIDCLDTGLSLAETRNYLCALDPDDQEVIQTAGDLAAWNRALMTVLGVLPAVHE